MNEKIIKKSLQLPEKTGVYIFLDINQRPIYIGKAVNIRKRVLSHLRNKTNEKDIELSKNACDIKFIVAKNETEALLLENSLIKKYKPLFNSRLKDDKTYPYLKITTCDTFPSLKITREIKADGSKYFGPYSNINSLKKLLRRLKKIFPIRTCNMKIEYGKKKKPCLYYHLNQCVAPCKGDIKPEDYRKIVEGFLEFLNGNYEQLLKRLKQEMEDYAKKLEFEKAAQLRDIIKAIEMIAEKQRVVLPHEINADIIAIETKENVATSFLIKVRNGKLIGSEQFLMQKGLIADQEELLEAFVKEYYIASGPPNKVILSAKPELIDKIKALLRQLYSKEIEVSPPVSKEEEDLFEMAAENAKVYLQNELSSNSLRLKTLKEIKELFNLPKIPSRIECYDISTLSGLHSVGSMVVFKDGLAQKKEYRRFKIRIEGKTNDYQMIREVIVRRFKHWPNIMPDLILIDGGITQIKAVEDALKYLNISNIPILGIAKKFELIYTQCSNEPIKLANDAKILHLFQRIRDEAHRFAVTYHRKVRRKSFTSILENMPGIGPKTRKLLLNEYKTLDELKKAKIEDLVKITGIGKTKARTILEYLKKLNLKSKK